VAFFAHGALATTPLSSAQYSSEVDNGQVVSSTGGTISKTDSNGTASAALGIFPSAYVDLSSATNTEADGAVSYSAVVDGPGGSLSIPVDLTYHITANVTGPLGTSLAGAYVDFSYIGGGLSSPVLQEDGGVDNITGTISTSETVGIPFFVILYGTVHAYDGGQSNLIIDPLLSIDSSFATTDPNYLNDYTISLSPGVGNAVGGVPEPVSWVIMILGIGGIGAALRRRRALARMAAQIGAQASASQAATSAGTCGPITASTRAW
jgi:hypothetical protein